MSSSASISSDDKGDFIKKPVKKGPTLRLSSFRLDYCSNPSNDRLKPTYTLDQVLKYQHRLKLTDEKSIKSIKKMQDMLQNKFVPKVQKFKGPEDECLAYIILSHNKISPSVDKICQLADKMIHSIYFGTEHFLEMFAKVMLNFATEQSTFAPLYTRFLQEIYEGLPTHEQKDALLGNITNKVLESAPKSISMAFFLGCLVSSNLVPPKNALTIAQNLIQNPTPDNLEILFNLMIFAGPVLEEAAPTEMDHIFQRITQASGNISIRPRVRFLLVDLTEERMTGWKTKSLIPKIVTVQNGEQEQKDEADDSIIREYINEGNVCSYWSPKMTYDVVFSLATTTMRNFDKAVPILKTLLERENDFASALLQNLVKVRARVRQPEMRQEFPSAVYRVGAIFAHMVAYGVDVEVFGSPQLPYDADTFSGLVEELDVMGRADAIRTMPWLSEMRFLPEKISHSLLLSELREVNMTEHWPAYECMLQLFIMIEGAIPAEEVSKYINGLDPRVGRGKAFVEFVAELIVLQRPHEYGEALLRCVAARPDVALLHVEDLGEMFGWGAEATATQIKHLATLIRADFTNFKITKRGEFHNSVIKFI